MKKVLFLIGLVFLGGCNTFQKLYRHEDHPAPTAQLTPPPALNPNLPNVLGYTPNEYKGWMPADGQIYLEPGQLYFAAYVYQAGQWIHPSATGTQTVKYDKATGVLKLTGFSTSTYYDVFQWMPN